MNKEIRYLFVFMSTILIPTAIVNMYLYWKSFNVNPFMFFDSSDIFSIVVPFAMNTGIILSGTFISILIFPPNEESYLSQKVIKQVLIPTWLLSLVLCIAVFIYKGKLSNEWPMMIFVGALGVNAIFFKRLLRLEEWKYIFTNELSIRTATFTLVYVPLLSVFLAYYNWYEIVRKHSFNYLTPSSLHNIPNLNAHKYLPILGKIGTKYVLSTPSFDEIIFLESKNINIIRMKKYKEKRGSNNIFKNNNSIKKDK